ncbi:MAG: large conductance mechanosensitive channel protein MscL [Oscillospiraceae bacterium]|nr:large conductance mechanosensitive channel protein MscL [Oscillospiraceae bacterium]MBR3861074.1 large conductance mechanosensitive channel protein MscL [Oscillospiraceae bacterium]MBR6096628.1 large conductance mechanosensitive channel protein MscL [Oscillospiraceae bacterium]MBR7055726.1 large conductance mechanosensitive channel protein MscL [Oscillospiraceae bacterium]
MKKLIKEFKEFIMRGNVLDMAVGVIVAGAFGKITTSLVNDIFMPFISFLFGTRDMSALNLVVRQADEAAGTEAITIGFGTLVATVIDFILVALVVFIIIKLFNKAREKAAALVKKQEEEAAPEEPAGPTTEELLGQILDELKKKK